MSITSSKPSLLGPNSATDGHLAVWDGATGSILKDGGAPGSGGISQLTGDVTAGPGSGSQTATIPAGTVTEAQQNITDNTTGNVSTGQHGYVKKLPGDPNTFLDGDGNFSTPSTSGGGIIVPGYYGFQAPVDADFSWWNQHSGTILDNGAGLGLTLTVPADNAYSWSMRTKSMGANTRVEAALLVNLPLNTANQCGGGIFLREVSSNKLGIIFPLQSNLGHGIAVHHWVQTNGADATGGVADVQNLWWGSVPIWVSAEVSGGDAIYQISADGLSWITIKTIALTTQFTTTPDEWGFAGFCTDNTYEASLTLLSFKES